MISFIFISALVLLAWVVQRGRKDNSPPSYKGKLPLIGHAHLLYGDCRHLWKHITRTSRASLEAGGVLQYEIGLQPYYVVTDPDDALTIANYSLDKHFVYSFSKRWLGSGLITSSGETWKSHRKLINPAFSVKVINGFTDIFNAQSRKLLRKLDGFCSAGSFDISIYLRQMALENVCLTALGISIEENAELLQCYSYAVETILNIYTQRFMRFWLHSDWFYNVSSLRKKEEQVLKDVNCMADVLRASPIQFSLTKKDNSPDFDHLLFLTQVIKSKKAALQNNKQSVSTVSGFKCKALLDLLLELSTEEMMTDEEIRHEIDTAVTAALDTTTLTLTYILVLLGTHQEIQQKVSKELEDIFGKEDRDVSNADLSSLVYLEAVIKETLRLYTPAPNIMRTLDKDVKLKNYTLKSGEHCVISAYGIHRHECWGPDREVFKPERWLEPETQRLIFAGFSLGRRTCIGKLYAMNSLKTFLTHLLRRYKVTANVSQLELKLDFFLKPSRGHFVSIERRQ